MFPKSRRFVEEVRYWISLISYYTFHNECFKVLLNLKKFISSFFVKTYTEPNLDVDTYIEVQGVTTSSNESRV